MPRKKKEDIASDLAKVADAMFAIRSERLALNRQANQLEVEEKQLKEQLTIAMEKHKLSAVGGEICKVERERVAKPVVGDWVEFYQYIAENDAFDCLYRRLNEAAIKERLEVDGEIKGLTQVWANKLSVHKV